MVCLPIMNDSFWQDFSKKSVIVRVHTNSFGWSWHKASQWCIICTRIYQITCVDLPTHSNWSSNSISSPLNQWLNRWRKSRKMFHTFVSSASPLIFFKTWLERRHQMKRARTLSWRWWAHHSRSIANFTRLHLILYRISDFAVQHKRKASTT